MRSTQSQGSFLTEVLIVVTILGIVAVVAVPNFSSTDPVQLKSSTKLLAEAMRFIRSESIRTGMPYGFEIQSSQKRIRLFRADIGTNPPTPVYDVYHPISKQLYDIDIDEHPFAAADAVNSSTNFRGTCNSPTFIVFDRNGIPFCVDPMTVILEQASVTLTKGQSTRIAQLDGITGRVTIQ